jgi:hypothetical protein
MNPHSIKAAARATTLARYGLKKTAFDERHVGALTGAVLGGGGAYLSDRSNEDSSQLALRTLLGAGLGGGVGYGVGDMMHGTSKAHALAAEVEKTLASANPSVRPKLGPAYSKEDLARAKKKIDEVLAAAKQKPSEFPSALKHMASGAPSINLTEFHTTPEETMKILEIARNKKIKIVI